MDDRNRLILMAKESDVEVVELRKARQRMTTKGTAVYHVRLRADIVRLVGYLRMIENTGARRVIIDRIAARRDGRAWDTSLEATVHMGRRAVPRVVGAAQS